MDDGRPRAVFRATGVGDYKGRNVRPSRLGQRRRPYHGAEGRRAADGLARRSIRHLSAYGVTSIVGLAYRFRPDTYEGGWSKT